VSPRCNARPLAPRSPGVSPRFHPFPPPKKADASSARTAARSHSPRPIASNAPSPAAAANPREHLPSLARPVRARAENRLPRGGRKGRSQSFAGGRPSVYRTYPSRNGVVPPRRQLASARRHVGTRTLAAGLPTPRWNGQVIGHCPCAARHRWYRPIVRYPSAQLADPVARTAAVVGTAAVVSHGIDRRPDRREDRRDRREDRGDFR
jgi:hypothetical protein